jgi:hypothetical protein
MKLFALLSLPIAISISAAAAFAAEMPSRESDLCYALRNAVVGHLSDDELDNLAGTCRSMRTIVNQERARRESTEEQRAIYLEHISNAKELIANAQAVDCLGLREQFPDPKAFKQSVLKKIDDFNKSNPGKWIHLDLSYNNIGNKKGLLKNLIAGIVEKAHSLGIDIVSLDLRGNECTELPENIFNNLRNLRTLILLGNTFQRKTNAQLHLKDNVNVEWGE